MSSSSKANRRINFLVPNIGLNINQPQENKEEDLFLPLQEYEIKNNEIWHRDRHLPLPDNIKEEIENGYDVTSLEDLEEVWKQAIVYASTVSKSKEL